MINTGVTSPNVCLQLQVIHKENIPNVNLSVSAHDFDYTFFCSKVILESVKES